MAELDPVAGVATPRVDAQLLEVRALLHVRDQSLQAVADGGVAEAEHRVADLLVVSVRRHLRVAANAHDRVENAAGTVGTQLLADAMLVLVEVGEDVNHESPHPIFGDDAEVADGVVPCLRILLAVGLLDELLDLVALHHV